MQVIERNYILCDGITMLMHNLRLIHVNLYTDWSIIIEKEKRREEMIFRAVSSFSTWYEASFILTDYTSNQIEHPCY